MRENIRPNAYQANQVSTVNKSKLIILMYEGAERFIAEAKSRIEAKDIAGRGVYISKAQRIINELAGSLNREKGGEVAVSLDNVYMEINKNLTEANIKGDIAHLEVSLRMLRTIKSAWEQVISNSQDSDDNKPAGPGQKPGVAVSC